MGGEALQRLGSISNASSLERKAAGKVLKELVVRHIDEEEPGVWADVKQNFSDDERKAMNVAFLAAKRRVNV